MPTTDGAVRVTVFRRWRAAAMLRPVGVGRWAMAVWLAAGLGAILTVSDGLGHPDVGSAVALGFVLTAVPTLPLTWRSALSTMAIRGVAVLGGAALAVLTAGHPGALAIAVVAAAGGGVLVARVGPTVGLAVVLVAVDMPAGGQGPSPAALLPYVAGALVVVVAWAAWFGCSEVARVRRARPRPGAEDAERSGLRGRYPHALRVGVAVAVAVLVTGLLPDDLAGGHWLITCVLLTVQPTAADTGLRLAQRISGNTVGALIAAVVLGTHPSAPAAAVLTVLLFTLAMALRPVNYTWWAITGPPVLLMISEYPDQFPWYEGAVRLAMNLAGAVIVLVVAVLPGYFRNTRLSDSVYKIQRRRSG
ncbi:FUSC family protein [Mycolicibacterium sp. P9-22]|uniref:FUSC family protein n=1 Tax=Mycolicibacterium sp. P9-22 TaxID=2024613 RepID=UPI0018844FEB|nr:FUSC family protein [Mycolicibacterium sp. P9-22]